MKPHRAYLNGLALALGLLTLGLVPGAARADDVKLTPEQAVALALKKNLDLRYEQLNPDLSVAGELQAKAPFDPVIFGQADVSQSPAGRPSASGLTGGVRGSGGVSSGTGENLGADLGIRKTFTTGTTVEARVAGMAPVGVSAVPAGASGPIPAYQAALQLGLRQALLKGVSPSANKAPIVSAQIKRDAAQKRLDRKAETVAADTLKAYWDLHAALANLTVQELALTMSQKTLNETLSLIQAGKLPASEEVSARYPVQTQERARLQAVQAVGNARDKLARLIGLVEPGSLATPLVVTAGIPQTELPRTGLDELLSAAMTRRGDVKAARLDVDSRQVDAAAAKHNLLPKLDLVGGLSLNLSDPINRTSSTSGALGATVVDTSPDRSAWGQSNAALGWSVGLVLEIPLGNSDAKGKKQAADLELRRAEVAVSKSSQSVAEELNVAFRAVRSAREQLTVTQGAAKVAEAKYQNELEKYRAGKSSATLVALVQADLIKEQQTREQALADFNKALVDLGSASGTLLEQLSLKRA